MENNFYFNETVDKLNEFFDRFMYNDIVSINNEDWHAFEGFVYNLEGMILMMKDTGILTKQTIKIFEEWRVKYNMIRYIVYSKFQNGEINDSNFTPYCDYPMRAYNWQSEVK